LNIYFKLLSIFSYKNSRITYILLKILYFLIYYLIHKLYKDSNHNSSWEYTTPLTKSNIENDLNFEEEESENWENEEDRLQWEEEQKRLDREWYNIEEGSVIFFFFIVT